MLFPTDMDNGVIYTLKKIDETVFSISFKARDEIIAILVYIILILKYRDPYLISFIDTGNPLITHDLIEFPQEIMNNASDNKTLLDTCIECFNSQTGNILFDCVRKNIAYIIDALMSVQSGDADQYILHETYRSHARKICYENNTDTYCYYKLDDISRDIIIVEKNKYCKDILYTCRHLADAFEIVGNALNWNANREGGEVKVEPEKWFEWIID